VAVYVKKTGSGNFTLKLNCTRCLAGKTGSKGLDPAIPDADIPAEAGTSRTVQDKRISE
jgi:hypothetical protein